MKKILLSIILIVSIFTVGGCKKDKKDSIESPVTKTLKVTYDESKSKQSIFKGGTLTDELIKNFTIEYQESKSVYAPHSITASMITLNTNNVGVQTATITYNGLSATVEVPVATPTSDFEIDATNTDTITKYNGTDEEVLIPRYIKGVEITKLSDNAFKSNINIKKVNMPLVTFIGNYAFYECTSLVSVIFRTTTPPSFGNNVFACSGNDKNWNITVPDGSKEAYRTALFNTTDTFLNTKIPNFNNEIANMELSVTYDGSQSKKSILKGDSLNNDLLKNFVVIYKLDGITAPFTLENNMVNLDTSKVGVQTATITYNGVSATVEVPVATPTSDFEVDTANTDTITKYNGTDEEVLIPRYINGVEITKLGNKSFEANNAMKKVYMPFITSFFASNAGSAFMACKGLVEVEMPLVESLGNYAFLECLSLEKVKMPLVKSIGDKTFSWCKELKNIEMPLVKSIGEEAFFMCTSLNEVKIPKAIDIKRSAFSQCTILKNVEMPLVKSIGEYAFFECGNLEKAEMPRVTSVRENAFYYCIGLKNVEMPLIESIGDFVFSGCEDLSSVVFGTITPPSFGNNVFANSRNDKDWNITVPSGSEIAYRDALNTDNILLDTKKPTINGVSYGWPL